MRIKGFVLIALSLCAMIIASSCAVDAYDEPIKIGDGEKAPYTNDVKVDFSAQYIRTNGGKDGAKYPVVQIIRSKNELSDYYERHKDEYDLRRRKDPAADSTVGFLDACDKYDDDFFKSNALLFVIVEEGSGSTRHKVTSLTTHNTKTRVNIETTMPEVGTCDMAQWHITIETRKENLPVSTNDIEVYINGVYRGVEEFVYLYQSEEKPYEPIGYTENIKTTITFNENNASYTFDGSNSIILTDILRNLDYSGQMCRCMADYKIETEFGSYGIKLDGEAYARSGGGQSDLTLEQAQKLGAVINWVGDEFEREGVLTKSKAIEIAEQNATVEYEKISAAFDNKENIWTVTFYTAKNTPGGEQIVTLGGDQIIKIGAFGKILSIAYGE